MKIILTTCLLFLTLVVCTGNQKRYHDGLYVYSDISQQLGQAQKIKVDGRWMYRSIR